jgi:predicted negative regulator of RcsB-dependent stress response
MREQMGDEQYQGALASLEAAAAMVEETRALMEGLPVPTPEEASLIGLDQARREMPQQRAALEGMREQMGDEQYQGALASLEAAAAMVEETRALMAGLPVPSPEEAALLSANEERIRAVLGEAGE